MSTTTGECELFRCQLKSLDWLWPFRRYRKATCVVTDKRILLSHQKGWSAQILLSNIEYTKVSKNWTGGGDVSIGTMNNDLPTTLNVKTMEDAHRLASQIQQAIEQYEFSVEELISIKTGTIHAEQNSSIAIGKGNKARSSV